MNKDGTVKNGLLLVEQFRRPDGYYVLPVDALKAVIEVGYLHGTVNGMREQADRFDKMLSSRIGKNDDV